MNRAASETYIPALQTASELSDSIPPGKPPVLTAVAAGEEPEPNPGNSVLKVVPQFETKVVERSQAALAQRSETRLQMIRRLVGELASEALRVTTGIEV